MNRTHYIFVDFENIHEVQLELIENKPVVVVLVLGERHKKLSVDLVKQLLKYPAQIFSDDRKTQKLNTTQE